MARKSVGDEARRGGLSVSGALTAGSIVNPTFTGQVIVPAGSAGTPAISPTGDTNTGIFSSGADTVNIATGGTERLRITNAGDVGIGSTSPLYRATVNFDAPTAFGNTAANYIQMWQNSTVNAVGIAVGDDLRAGIIANNSYSLELGTSGAPRLTINGSNASISAGATDSLPTMYATRPTLGVHTGGDLSANDGFAVYRSGADANGTNFTLAKTRGANTITHGLVASGDSMGRLHWVGSDGTNFIVAASIDAKVDGTPGTNDMPGRLSFQTTADGASVPTERMRIDNAGNVLIGTSSGGKLTVYDATSSVTTIRGDAETSIIVRRSSANTGAPELYFQKSRGTNASPTSTASGDIVGRVFFDAHDGTTYGSAASIAVLADAAPSAGSTPGRVVFATSSTGSSSPAERMRVTSNGSLLIGRTYGQDVAKIGIGGSTANLGVNASTIYDDTSISSNTTGSYTGISTYLSTAVASFTLASLTHFKAAQFTIGAGSSVTTQYGFLASGDMIGAGTNYGFYSAIASGSGRWNYYAAGTADNYFAGNVGIGITPTAKLHVSGTATITGTITTGLSAGNVVANSSGVLSTVAIEDDQPILAAQVFG